MTLIKEINRNSMIIRPSGRSTDFISPSFGYGCLYNCSYCYMKRHKPQGLDIAKNTMNILTEIYQLMFISSIIYIIYIIMDLLVKMYGRFKLKTETRFILTSIEKILLWISLAICFSFIIN
jgi:spore photoproduct lyase